MLRTAVIYPSSCIVRRRKQIAVFTLKPPPPISSERIFMSHIAQYIILGIFELLRASQITIYMCISRYLWNRFSRHSSSIHDTYGRANIIIFSDIGSSFIRGEVYRSVGVGVTNCE